MYIFNLNFKNTAENEIDKNTPIYVKNTLAVFLLVVKVAAPLHNVMYFVNKRLIVILSDRDRRKI